MSKVLFGSPDITLWMELGTLERAVWVSDGGENLVGKGSKTIKRREWEAGSTVHSCG